MLDEIYPDFVMLRLAVTITKVTYEKYEKYISAFHIIAEGWEWRYRMKIPGSTRNTFLLVFPNAEPLQEGLHNFPHEK